MRSALFHAPFQFQIEALDFPLRCLGFADVDHKTDASAGIVLEGGGANHHGDARAIFANELLFTRSAGAPGRQFSQSRLIEDDILRRRHGGPIQGAGFQLGSTIAHHLQESVVGLGDVAFQVPEQKSLSIRLKQAAKANFYFFALADVLDGSMEARRLSVPVSFDPTTSLDPANSAVWLAQSILDIVAATASDRLGQCLGNSDCIFRQNTIQISLGGQSPGCFLDRQGKDTRRHFVAHQVVGGQVPSPGADQSPTQGGGQPLLSGPQRLLRLFTFRDIGANRHELFRLAEKGHDGRIHPVKGTVLGAIFQLPVPDLAFFNGLPQFANELFAMVPGVNDPMIATEQFLSRILRDGTELVIDEGDLAAPISDRHNGMLVQRGSQVLQSIVCRPPALPGQFSLPPGPV